MPWLKDTEPHKSGPQKLQLAFKNALLRRLPASSLSQPLKELTSRYLVSSEEVAKVLLGFRSRQAGADDPLLFDYAEILLRLKFVDVGSLLLALLETSRFAKRTQFELSDKSSTGFPTCEERIFTILLQKYATGAIIIERSDLHGLVHVFARWMHSVTEYEMAKQLQDGGLHTADVFSFNMYEALASLALTALTNPAFRAVAKQSWWKKRRTTLVSEMQNFDSHVLQWMQSHLTGRLQVLTTFPPFIETDDEGKPVFTDVQILQSIQDLPIKHSRAGLYIWLNACLFSKPFTDDSSMIMYLQARSNGNIQSLVVDLLTAGFDTLTNAFRRKESEQSIRIVRSFICNKIPLLLSIVSGGLAPASSVEAFVQVAFATITIDPLPPISAGATEVREKLKVTRLEFLQACTLHGVLSDATVAAVLQETPSPSKAHKHIKENLMAKYASNINSMDVLVDEVEGMQGNAGAISGCIVETLNNLCVNSDTISLKVLCNILVRKLPATDIILQYTSAANLLLPLCNQLNNWTHDQDQVEFTPGYEEFSSILLLVLAAVHRYGLIASDIGLQNDDTFISSLLRDTPNSQLRNDLSKEQSTQLSKWIEGLYATDEHGETSGISDEVMRPCPPQAFYQLVPTLLEQSVMACKAGALPMKAFKGGLELLVMPFLLPSLVPGLSWLIKHSWENHDDADIRLQVLDKLLKPSSSSPETKAMHRTILGIVADPLYHSLQNLAQMKPGKKDIGPLLEILKPFLGQSRTSTSNKTELDRWMATPDGGILTSLRQAIQEQVAWVTNVGPTPPPTYSHRLYTTVCEAVGADRVLDAIIDEVKEQTKLGNGSYAIDIGTAMVCSPNRHSPPTVTIFPSTTSQTGSGSSIVREALRLRSNNLQDLLKKPMIDAESLVRLARRVDAQLVVTQMPQIGLELPLQNQAADLLMADLGLADENMAVAAQDASMNPATGAEFNNADLAAVLDQSMDLTDPAVQSLANLSSDPTAMPAGQAQDLFDLNMEMPESLTQLASLDGNNQAEQSVDDDIFAELDMSNIDDFNFT